MKKFITLLTTALTKEVKTTVGYTIGQILIILALTFSFFTLGKTYFDYRIETTKQIESTQDSLRYNEALVDSLLDFYIENQFKNNN